MVRCDRRRPVEALATLIQKSAKREGSPDEDDGPAPLDVAAVARPQGLESAHSSSSQGCAAGTKGGELCRPASSGAAWLAPCSSSTSGSTPTPARLVRATGEMGGIAAAAEGSEAAGGGAGRERFRGSPISASSERFTRRTTQYISERYEERSPRAASSFSASHRV